MIELFLEKKFQKKNQTEFRIEIVIKKVINYLLIGKDMIIRVIAGQRKKASLYKMSYYPEPQSFS